MYAYINIHRLTVWNDTENKEWEEKNNERQTSKNNVENKQKKKKQQRIYMTIETEILHAKW